MKINVGKLGIMHMRKKVVERCEMEYLVDGEVIPMASSYKYLGCNVDEHLELKEMVEEKAAAGKRALGAWMNRCKLVCWCRYVQEADECSRRLSDVVWG